MRRNIFLVGLVVGIALAAYFYSDIYYLFTKSSARFKAVPVESPFFIDCKGLSQLRKIADEQKLTQKLESFGVFQQAKTLQQFFQRFDTSSTNPFQTDVDNEQLLIATFPSKPGVTEFVFVLQMNKASGSDLQKWFATGSDAIQVDQRTVRGKRVYDLTFTSDKSHWSVGLWHGLCIVSPNTALVEQAIVQLKGSTNITDDKTFQRLKPANNDAYFHLYINYQNLASAAQGYADFAAYPYVQSLSRFASWTSLAFNPANGGVAVQGKTTTVRNNLQAMNDFLVPDDYKIWSLQQKPDNAALIVSTAVPTKSLKESSAFYNAPDFQKYIAPWLSGEISFVLVEPVDTSYGNQSLAFLRAENPEAALSALKPLNNVSNDSLSRLPIHYKTFAINQLRSSGLIGNAVQNAFTNLNSPYYTVAGKYVVMSNSLTQLKLYLERYADGKTLDKVKVPGMNTNSFARGSYNVYMNISLLTDLIMLSSRVEQKPVMRKQLSAYSQFSPAYLQFMPSKNDFAVEGFISGASREVRAAQASKYLWKTELDTSAVTQPQPLGDGEKQIAVQDAHNTLYILNRGGDVSWRKQLDGPIQGKIHSIDFYKNGDRQMVFATTGKIYLLDQAGDNVQNFPIALPCAATTPLSVVDMDDDRNYVYFVGCSNGLIYGYEKGGKPLGGWNPNDKGPDITHPIKHYRYRSHDFLMGVTDDGWLKFFTRYGEPASKPMPIGNRTANVFITDNEKGFRAVANDGTEYRLRYNGNIETINSPMFGVADALLADVLPDKSGYEKIMFDGKRIGVYSDDSTKVKTMILPTAASGELFVAQLPSGQYFVGVGGASKVWLMSGDGKVANGFPRAGNGTFIGTDLYSNDQLVLIGLADDNVVVAYAVE